MDIFSRQFQKVYHVFSSIKIIYAIKGKNGKYIKVEVKGKFPLTFLLFKDNVTH